MEYLVIGAPALYAFFELKKHVPKGRHIHPDVGIDATHLEDAIVIQVGVNRKLCQDYVEYLEGMGFDTELLKESNYPSETEWARTLYDMYNGAKKVHENETTIAELPTPAINPLPITEMDKP